MVAETPYLREPGYAERYRDHRFARRSGPATHRREVAAIRRLLGRAGAGGRCWLDLPAGAGRLSDLLPGAVVRVDRDPAMLRACSTEHPRACASALALPFADASFGGALCMRLMQHIPGSAERVAILRELRRVTRGPILVSFFEAFNLQHARRLLAGRLRRRRSGRSAIPARRFRAELAAAGLTHVASVALRRFVSEQWITLARSS